MSKKRPVQVAVRIEGEMHDRIEEMRKEMSQSLPYGLKKSEVLRMMLDSALRDWDRSRERVEVTPNWMEDVDPVPGFDKEYMDGKQAGWADGFHGRLFNAQPWQGQTGPTPSEGAQKSYRIGYRSGYAEASKARRDGDTDGPEPPFQFHDDE